MIKVEFTKDFAIYKKGDVTEVTSFLAIRLFREKVAREFKAKAKVKKKK